VEFAAINVLFNKAILEKDLSELLGGDKADQVEEQINTYSVIAGLLPGMWGLVLPYVIEDRIVDAVKDPSPVAGTSGSGGSGSGAGSGSSSSSSSSSRGTSAGGSGSGSAGGGATAGSGASGGAGSASGGSASGGSTSGGKAG
jgi:hypothetical protein